MGRYDYFVADLKCPECNAVTDVSLDTQIQAEPSGIELKVGTRLIEIEGPEILYGTYQKPKLENKNTFNIIISWICKHCGEPLNFAQIDIEDSIITSISTIEQMSENIIRNVNYVEDELSFIGWKVSEGSINYTPVRRIKGKYTTVLSKTMKDSILSRLKKIVETSSGEINSEAISPSESIAWAEKSEEERISWARSMAIGKHSHVAVVFDRVDEPGRGFDFETAFRYFDLLAKPGAPFLFAVGADFVNGELNLHLDDFLYLSKDRKTLLGVK